jgi:PTS system fructose-specific IIA component/PTS system nitrogen regulatory IIA component
MSHFVVRDACTASLVGTGRDSVVRELVQGLADAGSLPAADLDDVVRAVLRREQLGSTGIGRGIAIPHTRYASVSQLVGAVGLSKHPGKVPFDSIDGDPVDIFVLLISPQDRPGDHLRALENVVQTMKDDATTERLRACTTRDELCGVLFGGGAG